MLITLPPIWVTVGMLSPLAGGTRGTRRSRQTRWWTLLIFGKVSAELPAGGARPDAAGDQPGGEVRRRGDARQSQRGAPFDHAGRRREVERPDAGDALHDQDLGVGVGGARGRERRGHR